MANVRQNALADAIGIEGASLVRLIDELQASGLVTREPDPSDRRANVVSLHGPRGAKWWRKSTRLLALREQIFAGLPPGDIEATDAHLRRDQDRRGRARQQHA